MAAIEKTVTPIEAVWDRREDNLARFRDHYTQYDKDGGKFVREIRQLHERPEVDGNTAILEGRVIRDLWTGQTFHSTLRLQYFCTAMTDYGVPGSGKATVSENFGKMKRVLCQALSKRPNPTKSKSFEQNIQNVFALAEGDDEKAIIGAGETYNLRYNKLEKMQFACRTMLESVKETGDLKQDVIQKEIAMSKMRAFLGEICPPVMLRSKKMHVQSNGALTSKPDGV